MMIKISANTMNPNKLKFLTEKYEKESKHLKFQEHFIALPGLKPIAGKFYAKHDVLPHDTPKKYIDLVKKSGSVTPKESFVYPPPSVNMQYGWFTEPLIPRSSDQRLAFPIKQCDYIEKEIYIRQMQDKLPKIKFTGVPFHT